MNTLIDLINRHLKSTKGLMIQEFVVDFAQDYNDEQYYFLQIKYINTVDIDDKFQTFYDTKSLLSRIQDTNKIKTKLSPLKT